MFDIYQIKFLVIGAGLVFGEAGTQAVIQTVRKKGGKPNEKRGQSSSNGPRGQTRG